MAKESSEITQKLLTLSDISSDLLFLSVLLENSDVDNFSSRQDAFTACGRMLQMYGNRIFEIVSQLDEIQT